MAGNVTTIALIAVGKTVTVENHVRHFPITLETGVNLPTHSLAHPRPRSALRELSDHQRVQPDP